MKAHRPTIQLPPGGLLRIIILLVGAAVIWAIGLYAHDPWLRPWKTVVVSCFIALLVWTIAFGLFVRGHRNAGEILIVAALFFAIPLPSSVESAVIQNRAGVPLSIRFSTLDHRRNKETQLPSGENWKFVYFSGDEPKAIPVVLEARNPESSLLVRTQITLSSSPLLRISKQGLQIITDPESLASARGH